MSDYNQDTKTPTPEEIERVFSYLQKVLTTYALKAHEVKDKKVVQESNPVEDESLNESNTDENGSTKDNQQNTYKKSYNNTYGRRTYNGYRRSYYNGKYSYNGSPRRSGYKNYKNQYNGAPGQVDPEEDNQ